MITLLLSFFFSTAFACDFRADISGVYSLSGPVTQFLEDNGLLKSTKLKGISTFHPASNFHGARLPGGIYLSQSKLVELRGSVVFYDRSEELRRLFKLHPEIRSVEINSRGMAPVEVMLEVERQVTSYTSGCVFNAIEKMKERLERLKTLIPSKPWLIFFLGKIQSKRLPEMVMVNDGIVKWMVTEGLIKSYPSSLAYLNWSAKVLQQLPAHRKVGIVDTGSSSQKSVERVGKDINLTYPGALIPGRGQVEAMIFLFENLSR